MRKTVIDVLMEDKKHESRPIRTDEFRELESLLKEHGSFIGLTSAYYFGYIMALKREGVIRTSR